MTKNEILEKRTELYAKIPLPILKRFLIAKTKRNIALCAYKKTIDEVDELLNEFKLLKEAENWTF